MHSFWPERLAAYPENAHIAASGAEHGAALAFPAENVLEEEP
jgi:hypothetical protein